MCAPHSAQPGFTGWFATRPRRCLHGSRSFSAAFYELINSGDLDQFVGLLAEDFVEHEETPVPGSGGEPVKQLFTMMQSAFPNMRWEPQEVLVDGDRAVARVRFNATNDGEFMGMPATGKNVSIQVIDII